MQVADWFLSQFPHEKVRFCHQLDHATSGVGPSSYQRSCFGKLVAWFTRGLFHAWCLEVLLMAATKVGDPFDQFWLRFVTEVHRFSARQLDEFRTKDGCFFWGVDICDSNPQVLNDFPNLPFLYCSGEILGIMLFDAVCTSIWQALRWEVNFLKNDKWKSLELIWELGAAVNSVEKWSPVVMIRLAWWTVVERFLPCNESYVLPKSFKQISTKSGIHPPIPRSLSGHTWPWCWVSHRGDLDFFGMVDPASGDLPLSLMSTTNDET